MVLNDLTKVAIITGITGQDGSYLAELLLSKNFHIIGITRDLSKAKCSIAPSLHNQIEFIEWDYSQKFDALVADRQPDEFYNFAGYSSGQGMYDAPVEIGMTNGIYVAGILNSIQNIRQKQNFVRRQAVKYLGLLQAPPNRINFSKPSESLWGSKRIC